MAESLIVGLIVAVFASITAPLIIIRLGDRTRRIDREAEWARQEKIAARADRKLDVIHTLVNSGMTRAMEAEHAATERELAGMLEIIELRRSLGQEPTIESLAAVKSIRGRLAELTGALAERRRQEAIAERQFRQREENDPE